MTINELWHSQDEGAWRNALDRYMQFVKPADHDIVKELEPLDLVRIRSLDARGWYDFLHDKYFRWKYTAPNRLATTRRSLRTYLDKSELNILDAIRHRLLSLDTHDIAAGLQLACEVRGLGVAGASGLLALMYPDRFATVDQFLVKALRLVDGIPDKLALERMNPEGLTVKDGVVLIQIVREKALSNNALFGGTFWTPKKIDELLWTYGR